VLLGVLDVSHSVSIMKSSLTCRGAVWLQSSRLNRKLSPSPATPNVVSSLPSDDEHGAVFGPPPTSDHAQPVLLRLQRLLEPSPLARWFGFPPREQSCLLQHPPNARRTHRHSVRVEHRERQPTIAFQRILQMEIDDRFLLPPLQPEIPRNPTVVFVDTPCIHSLWRFSKRPPTRVALMNLCLGDRREPIGAVSLLFRYGENSGDSTHARPHFYTSCHY
jgi:hypothetical protein